MGLLERYKGTSSAPSHRPVGCCGSQNTTGRQAIWNPVEFVRIFLYLPLFLSLLTATLQGGVLKKTPFLGAFAVLETHV